MASSRRIRILIVDDSAVMRSLLRAVVKLDPQCEVAGVAADGQSALGMLESLRPDLILLDVEMPVMDGLVTLRELRRRGFRMPVIMCSSLTQRGARVTLEALAGGASDYVAKPAGQTGVSASLLAFSQELLPKIHALTAAPEPHPTPHAPTHPAPHIAPTFSSLIATGRSVQPPSPFRLSAAPSVLVVAVSTGGPAALDVLLPSLHAGFPLPVLIVQHMPDLFTQMLAERLGQRCALHVREAAEGAPVHPGTIHIARGNWHLEVLAPSRTGMAATLHLTQAPHENHCRPSADVLFRTAAAAFGAGVVALVLTGMGSDGLAGCRAVRARGGCVLVQDQASSVIWGMPGAVAGAGLAHRVLPLSGIAPELLRLTRPPHCEARDLRETVAL